MSKQKSPAPTIWHTPCWGEPPLFRKDSDAIQWAIGQGAFTNEAAATAVFTAFKQRCPIATWAYWLGHIAGILTQQGKGTPIAQNAPAKAKRPVQAKRPAQGK